MKTATTRICTLMVTHGCNLGCIYCFEKYKSNDPSRRMSFDTATKILEKEFAAFAISRKENERFAVEFFGGEPLLNFDLIKEVYEWCRKKTLPFEVVYQITTNGTLLDREARQWFTERKEDFRIILSVDGTEVMQARNRGCDIDDIPIAFVRDTWEKSYFKMTVSRETLPSYADGVISLSEHGYRIASSLAEGIDWQPGDEELYRTQLQRIARWYMDHPETKPEHPFNFIFNGMLAPDALPGKNCGVGSSIATYDIDGRCYPCHLFLPIVHGREEYEKIAALDFSRPEALLDNECLECPLRNVCRTCYGYNYLLRGDISRRNLSNCRMHLVEAQVLSAFEVEYLTARSKSHTLTDEELVMLKAALNCYTQLQGLSSDTFRLKATTEGGGSAPQRTE